MELDFYPASDFEKVPESAPDNVAPHLSLLAMVGRTGQLTEDFRLVVTGQKEILLEFTGDQLYPHAALQPNRFTVSLDPEELVLPVNRIAGPWINLREMVAKGGDFLED